MAGEAKSAELTRVDPTTTVLAALDEGITPERVELVQRTVAKGATADELAMLFSLAQRYGLDPFAKEIWCICELERNGDRKTDASGNPKPPQIMASRDGFLAIANRHTAFDGMDSDVVCENDDFKRVPGGVEHSYGASDRGKPRGAYALVYRKDRAVATFFFAKWAEYGEPNLRDGQGKLKSWTPWAKYPSAMILKVAEAMALKRAFSLSGLTAEEELHAGDAIEDGAEGQFHDRPRLSQPRVSAASRGIGRAHTAPADLRPQRTEPVDQVDVPDETGDETGEDGDEKLFGGNDE